MLLKPSQLHELLERDLRPAYLLYGDEPWQLTFLADKIRQAARRHGFEERLFYVVLPEFDWREMTFTASPGLFARKRLLDVFVPGGKVDREGGQALERFARNPPQDTLLLLILESATPPSGRWFQALAEIGVVVRVERTVGEAFKNWLKRRALALGVDLSEEALALLAQKLEGNLVVADQLLQQLLILHGERAISVEQVREVVEEACRISLFDWLAAILRGDARQALLRLKVLKEEGTPPALVLWGMVQEIRKLLQLRAERSPKALRLGPRQQRLLAAALERLPQARLEELLQETLEIDRQIKGLAVGDPWLALERLTIKTRGPGPKFEAWEVHDLND